MRFLFCIDEWMHAWQCVRAMKAIVFKTRKGRWKFRVKSRNGRIVATCGSEEYPNARTAIKTIRVLARGGWRIQMHEGGYFV